VFCSPCWGQLRYFASAAVFKSEFLGLVFAKSAFCGFADFTGITSARHCQSTHSLLSRFEFFFDRVTLGMRGLVFTTEGINQKLTPKVHESQCPQSRLCESYAVGKGNNSNY